MEKPVTFESEEAMKKALPSYYNDQKDWEDDRKSYTKTKKDVQAALSKISRLLWSHCDITIRNKMQSDKDFQVMKDNDGGEIYRIITKIMNGVAAVQNPIRASIESLFNLLFIRGDQYDSLSEYYQTFENRRMTAETLGTMFASEALRDLVIEEYNTKKQTTSDVYKRLLEWQTACAVNHRSMT